MKQEQITIKATVKSRELLRIVAATTGEKHYEVLERLLEKERHQLGAAQPPVSRLKD